MIDVTSPGSLNDLVELLVPELQRRGIYWDDYPVPSGGTARETIMVKPGEPFLAPDHPATKFRWNADAAAKTDAFETSPETKTESVKMNGADNATVTVAAV
jgi:hypothetical protein